MTFKLLPLAFALASASTFAAEAVDQPKIWSGDVEFGYTNLSGNTEESTTVGKFNLLRESAPWKFAAHVEGLASEKDEERTAEKYSAFTRLEYNFTAKNYVFGRVSYEEDKFNGYENQYTATSGLGWNVYDLDTFDWDLEGGVGYRAGKLEDPLLEDEEETIVRLSTLVDWKFSETGTFTQLLSTEIGDENTISYSKTAIKVQVIGQVSLKLSYNIKYTEEVPDGTEHADKETVVSVTYSF
ncbi:DUF481 domain-containing protein [Thalassotalea sp. ND16A]|uniref:DUF481 domain-containing protein n=1 Tax=Thalassotalea sp. ND16A TaxID=1535422 RepID=UPI00051D0C2D|nr:DUF481 domain-containing protein [Thalassotalea sp. ND16A]KGJ89253.1 hypothetical protein ND16A_2146 [Thalassotalea sp. ND16A]